MDLLVEGLSSLGAETLFDTRHIPEFSPSISDSEVTCHVLRNTNRHAGRSLKQGTLMVVRWHDDQSTSVITAPRCYCYHTHMGR